MQVIETPVYTFDELDASAKDTARSWFRDGMLDYDWYESIFDDAKEIGSLMGIDIDKIYFSGFSSQGDGACFEGSYQYAKGSVAAIKDYAPLDYSLQAIARDLQAVQRKHFYNLHASIKHTGRYSHEYCTRINVWKEDDIENEDLVDTLRSFMRSIYRSLESEYDYQNSNEQIDDTIRANEYTFTESGTRFG